MQRRALLGRGVERLDDRLGRRHAERAAHEIEILHRDDDRQAVELAEADFHRVVQAGLGAGVLQAIGIAALVAEFQRIERHLRQLHVEPGLAVEHGLEAGRRAHAHVVVRAGDHPLVRLDVLVEDELAGLRTLDPEILRHIPALQEVSKLRRDFGNPVHVHSAATRRAERTPRASSATRSVTLFTVRALALPLASRLCRTASTSADPTTTASARFGDALRIRGGAHAEADRDRQLGVALDAGDCGIDLARIGRRGAGDAGDRDVIDEARGVLQHRGQALVVGGGGGEPDEGDAGLERRQAKLLVLLGRQIDDDQPVDAGGFRVLEETIDAIDIDRIVITHEHDRRGVILLAEGAHQLERLLHVLAGMQRAQRTMPGSPGRRPWDR